MDCSVPPGSFASVEEVLGTDGKRRVALRAIEINEPMLKTKISGFGGRASLSTILAPEMRASTIRVNDINGVAGFVLPGDHVDIMLTRSAGGSEANLLTDILLQNVKVLAIDQDANEDRAQPAVVKAVTLEVTPVRLFESHCAGLVFIGAVRLLLLRDDSPVQICNLGFLGIRPGLATFLE